MNILVGLFRSYGLEANVSKSHTITCQPGALRVGMSEEAIELNCAGVGELYRVRLRRRIPFQECGVGLTVGSMTSRRCRMHGTDPAIYWSWLPVIQTVHQPHVYGVSFPRMNNRCPYPCPFPGCPSSSHTCNGLGYHFNMQHWGDRIIILKKHPNPLPRCEWCRIQVPEGRLNHRHYTSDKCKQGGGEASLVQDPTTLLREK